MKKKHCIESKKPRLQARSRTKGEHADHEPGVDPAEVPRDAGRPELSQQRGRVYQAFSLVELHSVLVDVYPVSFFDVREQFPAETLVDALRPEAHHGKN